MMSPTFALFMLLSVAAPLARAISGEYCHAWMDSINTWHRGFHCPERYDGEDARYCCGTCALRYCCTSAEVRLDQSTCDTEPENSDKIRKIKPSVPTYLPFVIVVSAFLSFVLLGALVSICCCQCVKPSPNEQQGPASTQISLLESGGPSPKSSTHSCTGPLPMNLSELSTCGRTPAAFPGSQVQAFAPALHQGASRFYQPYQPYLSYPLPPEHTVLVGAAFLDGRAAFGQQTHGQTFSQAPVHTDTIHPAVTI